jgi:phosphohistidine phosphatase
MNLYLLRHASAGTQRTNPLLDTKRPLDKDGKQHCIVLAQVLGSLNVQFDLVVSSPLKRSLQTAALVGTELGYESKILISKALAPEGTLDNFRRLLETCGSYENVLVVGHNPNLTAFLGSLIVPSNGEAGRPASLRLRKGSIARVNMERRPASLQWLLDPRIVRTLYTSSATSVRRKTPKK